MVCEGMSATLGQIPRRRRLLRIFTDDLRELGFDPAALLAFFPALADSTSTCSPRIRPTRRRTIPLLTTSSAPPDTAEHSLHPLQAVVAGLQTRSLLSSFTFLSFVLLFFRLTPPLSAATLRIAQSNIPAPLPKNTSDGKCARVVTREKLIAVAAPYATHGTHL